MAKLISVSTWVREELDRIEAFCGDRPEDWLDECAENAVKDWTDEDGWTDWESVEYQIACDGDQYMEFIQRCYPDRVKGELK